MAKMVIYKDFERSSVLMQLARVCSEFRSGSYEKEKLIECIYEQVHRILDIATQFGFDENLWHNYLAYLIATGENPFSISCEKSGALDGTVNVFAKSDFALFKQLFDYDFSPMERALGIDCFSVISHYRAVAKKEKRYNKSVSERVRELSRAIEAAKSAEEILEAVTGFYRDYGVGTLGLNKAFRPVHTEKGLTLQPITNTDDVRLSHLVGYELQKKTLVENTEAFLAGRRANNVLLFGDSGTGKSTSIKAILNEYYPQGLRMVEIYKHQFQDLSAVISIIKNRNYRFIIYMDDLSFEEFEIEYKYLKAVIEGGLETKPENVLIYATSNRRHLIRETWSDRSDMSDDELHRSDTMQEKLSLVNRFGISINYSSPSVQEYYEIVRRLAAEHPQITLSDEELCLEASRWEMRHGGISGRTAQQFIDYLAGKK